MISGARCARLGTGIARPGAIAFREAPKLPLEQFMLQPALGAAAIAQFDWPGKFAAADQLSSLCSLEAAVCVHIAFANYSAQAFNHQSLRFSYR